LLPAPWLTSLTCLTMGSRLLTMSSTWDCAQTAISSKKTRSFTHLFRVKVDEKVIVPRLEEGRARLDAGEVDVLRLDHSEDLVQRANLVLDRDHERRARLLVTTLLLLLLCVCVCACQTNPVGKGTRQGLTCDDRSGQRRQTSGSTLPGHLRQQAPSCQTQEACFSGFVCALGAVSIAADGMCQKSQRGRTNVGTFMFAQRGPIEHPHKKCT